MSESEVEVLVLFLFFCELLYGLDKICLLEYFWRRVKIVLKDIKFIIIVIGI